MTLDVRPSARDVLSHGRALFDPALRAAVDRLPGTMRHIAGYHFGWWDADGTPLDADQGKAIRPTMTLCSAAAVGGAVADAVPAAVAVELVHNFTLLHDDVMDRDRTRRHRATAWCVFGTGQAILAGDALLTLAYEVLAEDGHPAFRPAATALSHAVLAVQDGQAADLSFETRTDVTLPECVRMAQQKTAALLGCATGLGALYGGGTPEQVDHLRSFGEHIGLAFQLVDDLLGIWGDPEVTGKPVHSDLVSRKKSLPVVAALRTTSPAADRLAELYLTPDPLAPATAATAADLVAEAGGRAWCRDEIATHHARAAESLRLGAVNERPAAELSALADLITHRDH
ncbi:family 2 encapsulin nanocompartment cargo protein polyprenyl transferase [Actinokineospora sp. UTMC 2448]|uniref:family 2 encapsulin nanocompartment cargo protein polyprenyl transferase n=1 Tax=Actinokineospora sp. UTMC 2448 TaxID=2268449 RepID=UPI002164E9AC|nr:family 2 encapsulin nanocompartment cargo protein polyprenyl transferase [Actinokineospora sp. UTMC 2448]UVS80023.1 (2E,6E)-farnesyl diphosphate synthase [Actinokineospora sp. UTMC 2448]